MGLDVQNTVKFVSLPTEKAASHAQLQNRLRKIQFKALTA